MKAREATQPITARAKVALAGAATGMVLLALTAGSAFAGGAVPGATGAASQTQGHGQMHQMMNSVHGEGTSQQMHEAMGPQSEKMMDQCASGMDNMENMQSMMDGGMQGGGMQGGQENQPQDGQ